MKRHKDALKRQRASLRRRSRNRSTAAELKTLRRAVLEAPAGEAAQKALRAAISAIGKAASKKVIHRNRAARIVSRLTKSVNSRKA